MRLESNAAEDPNERWGRHSDLGECSKGLELKKKRDEETKNQINRC